MTEAAAQYKRDGYYIARQLLPATDVERVFADMHRLVLQQLDRYGLPRASTDSTDAVHEDLQTLFRHDVGAYLATLTLCAKLVSLFELYMHPHVRAFVATIGIDVPVFQTTPVMHLMSRALKVPGGYQGFGAHQDWPTLQGSLDTVTVWLPFVDVDRNLFTLDIIPGSHLLGLVPYERKEHIYEVDPAAYDPAGFEAVEAKRGDVVFMSSFAIHRSSTTGDDRLRVSTSWRYESASESHFVRRGYPFAQKRSVIPDLITPGFPSKDQVEETFS